MVIRRAQESLPSFFPELDALEPNPNARDVLLLPLLREKQDGNKERE
jgi:hypothetical protein